MGIDFLPKSYVIRFSNTGKRGTPKYFDISLSSLKITLEDIKKNFTVFSSATNYVEATWRDLFSQHLTDPSVNALSTVQTLPLYAVINKALCSANNISSYQEKIMPLSIPNLEKAIKTIEMVINPFQGNPNIIGENKIYYGAPGTGKSYDIEQRIPRAQNIRTVFHSDTQYGDFVGCLKPTMNNGSIEYSYAPGPFTTAIITALNKPNEHIYLTIEEINRAPAASVFGDIFQLLDRNETGKSTYSIDITDRDWLNYLNKNLITELPSSQLSIPNNLSIYATMNSSDQAVMPLDTAFKRRWIFEYKSLDFHQPHIPQGKIPLAKDLNEIPWAELAIAINSCLSEHNIPEDRLLGPWFITEKEINSSEKALATLTGKILNYIWDDVLRHQQRNIIFRPDLKTFAQVCDEINTGNNVYSNELNNKLQIP